MWKAIWWPPEAHVRRCLALIGSARIWLEHCLVKYITLYAKSTRSALTSQIPGSGILPLICCRGAALRRTKQRIQSLWVCKSFPMQQASCHVASRHWQYHLSALPFHHKRHWKTSVPPSSVQHASGAPVQREATCHSKCVWCCSHSFVMIFFITFGMEASFSSFHFIAWLQHWDVVKLCKCFLNIITIDTIIIIIMNVYERSSDYHWFWLSV